MEPVSKVFVYGALRRGASNHWRMEGAQLLGETTVTGTLVKIDWYPGVVLEGETSVYGEVYEIDEKILAELDEFEGIGNDSQAGEYERVTTVIDIDGRSHEVFLYEWQKGVSDYEIVPNGDWLTEDASR